MILGERSGRSGRGVSSPGRARDAAEEWWPDPAEDPILYLKEEKGEQAPTAAKEETT